MTLNNLRSHKMLVSKSSYFFREANDNFLFVCGSQRESAVEKKSENLEEILTADGRRWTQINTDGFSSLDDLSREKPEALRANMSNCFYREANDNFLFVCGSLRASAVKKNFVPHN